MCLEKNPVEHRDLNYVLQFYHCTVLLFRNSEIDSYTVSYIKRSVVVSVQSQAATSWSFGNDFLFQGHVP